MNVVMEQGLALVALVGGPAVGIWLGARAQRAGRTADDTLGTLNGAALGLLALMMGFTFSIALARYDGRRQAVLVEANAIGTAWLRAGALAEGAAESRRLLREYAETRLLQSMPTGEAGVAFDRAAGAMHARLWGLAEAALKADARSVPAGLYASALNEVIDAHEKRVTVLRGGVPGAVFMVLVGMAAFGLGMTGYAAAVGQGRREPVALMAVALGAVLLLVADLDAPREGFIKVSQGPMRDLLAGLGK